MLYYVYYNAYGHAQRAVSAEELAQQFSGSTDLFFKFMCSNGLNQEFEAATGHVGTLRFADEAELREFLDSLGSEISNFYDCVDNSRPYNF